MDKFIGKGVYGAVAIGKVSVFERGETAVKRLIIEDTAAEKQRLQKAKAQAIGELSEIYENALEKLGKSDAQIFEIHMMMVEDDDYNESIESIIDSQKANAEYAVAATAESFAEIFSAIDDSYMQARAADVRDISNRIIACLTGEKPENALGGDLSDMMIVCADDLAPSETVRYGERLFKFSHGNSSAEYEYPCRSRCGRRVSAQREKRRYRCRGRLYGRGLSESRRCHFSRDERKAESRRGEKIAAARA
jgi:phosphotransferase system enzyme I (PtsI)